MGTRNSISLLSFFTFSHLVSLNFGAPLAPALYALGDSIFDGGNNNFLPTLAKANYLPYGSNFEFGATGRFTNNKTIADCIAEFLELPYLPPSLSLRGTITKMGVNYASGSCGILPETGSNMGKCLSLDNQLDMLQELVEKGLPILIKNTTELSDYLTKSIVIFSVGSNDYINNYLRSDFFNTSSTYTPQQFAQLLIAKFSMDLERVYKLGFRKIVVFGIGQLGCIPALTWTMPHTGPCVEEINLYVSYYNALLAPSLFNLTATLPGSTFVLGGASSPNITGITNADTPCCKTANITGLCVAGLPPCPDVQGRYFFDEYHPTDTVYSAIGSACIFDSSYCYPSSIQDLVQA